MNSVPKRTFCAIIICFLFSATMLVAQTAYEPSGLEKKIITGVQVDVASVTVKDNDGYLRPVICHTMLS